MQKIPCQFQGAYRLAIKKDFRLNLSKFLLQQIKKKFNLDKLPVFGFELQCLVLAQNLF